MELYQKLIDSYENYTSAKVSVDDEDFNDDEKEETFEAVKFNKSMYYIPENGLLEGLNAKQATVPKPIMPEAVKMKNNGTFPIDKASKIEWQSLGRVRLDLQKLVQPSRWYHLQSDSKTNKLKSGQMWWDLHLLYRKRLVKF